MITQATPTITGVRIRQGRSSSVFTFVEGVRGPEMPSSSAFLTPLLVRLILIDFEFGFEFEIASSSEFPTPILRGLEVLSSDFGHPHLAKNKNMVIVSLYMATRIPYRWPW